MVLPSALITDAWHHYNSNRTRRYRSRRHGKEIPHSWASQSAKPTARTANGRRHQASGLTRQPPVTGCGDGRVTRTRGPAVARPAQVGPACGRAAPARRCGRSTARPGYAGVLEIGSLVERDDESAARIQAAPALQGVADRGCGRRCRGRAWRRPGFPRSSGVSDSPVRVVTMAPVVGAGELARYLDRLGEHGVDVECRAAAQNGRIPLGDSLA